MSWEAKNQRLRRVWEAYRLRMWQGLSMREIAAEMGVSRSWVGKWLQGVPRVKQP
jgi:transcriptional regulator with XRE-family HTH domain